MRNRKAILCAITFVLIVSLVLPLGCAKETAQEILGRAVKAINEVESFHMVVTQTLTTPDETFTLSLWDATFKREDGVFVIGQNVDPKSKEVTDYEALFAADGKIYIQPLGSESQWIPIPPSLSQSMTGSLRGLQSATLGQVVDLQDTLQQYTELNRDSDDQFDGQSVYVLKGTVDAQRVIEQMTSVLGIPIELPEDTEIDLSMTEQILIRQNDYLPVRVVAVTIATLKSPDDELTIKWEGETVFSDFNAPVEIPRVDAVEHSLTYPDKDDLTAEDDDLLVSRIAIPETENAFTYFNQAVEKIYWPEDKEGLIFDIIDGEEWDTSFIAELISQNEQSFNLLEEGLTYSNSQAPESTSLDAPRPEVRLWLKIAQLSSIKATYLFKQGKEKAAFDEAIKVIKIGHMIQDSQGGLIYHLIGMAMKRIGLERLREMVADTTLSPELLRSYVDELGELKANREGLAYALKVDYTVMAKNIDDLSTGEASWGRMTGETEEEAKARDKMVQTEYFFMPNKTKRLFAEVYRDGIANIPKHYAEMKFLDPQEFYVPLPDPESELSIIKFALSPNSQGNMFYMLVMPSLSRFVSGVCLEDFWVSGTQLLLAMKSYKSETGSLPQSLGELMPEYILKVPEDPYDGNPIRYLPEGRTIYSVGEDLIDAGGSEEDDLTFKIEF